MTSSGTQQVTPAQKRLLADVARGAVTHHGGHAYRAGCRVDARVAPLINAGLVRSVRVHDFMSRYELTDAGRAAAGCDQRPARTSITTAADPFALVASGQPAEPALPF